jgi:ATP-dependent Clp protease adaptor protein ClpS
LGLAYECEQRNVRGPELLDGLPVPPDEYAQMLVVGVDEHHDEIDAVIRKFSEHWSLERMPVVDRAVAAHRHLRARLAARGPDGGRDHGGGRAREGVLDQGFGRSSTVCSRASPRSPARGREDRGGECCSARSRDRTEEIVVPDTSKSSSGTDERRDVPWVVIVWDDPINLMDYVTFVFAEAVRLFEGEGDEVDAPGAQRRTGRRGAGTARSARSTSRDCTRTAWATMQTDD